MFVRLLLSLSLVSPVVFASDESSCTFPTEEAPGMSLLQAKQASASKDTDIPKPSAENCPLPAGAAWCQVRLANLAPFWMAVYESGAGEMNANKDWVSWNICHNGFWEDQDIGLFGAPGNMLDIGGNVGFHTFAFAHAGWTVNSFEPMAPNLALQAATMCANQAFAGKVNINSHGLGTSAQTCQMVSPKDNLGDGFTKCGKEGEALTPDFKFSVVGTFNVRRLDGVLAEKALPNVDVVKIDVEGYEAEVFAGAPNFLAQYHPRVIKSEVWPTMTGSTGVKYLTMFENAGYKFFDDAGCTIPTDLGIYATGDVYMCHAAAGLPPTAAPVVLPAVAAKVAPAQPPL